MKIILIAMFLAVILFIVLLFIDISIIYKCIKTRQIRKVLFRGPSFIALLITLSILASYIYAHKIEPYNIEINRVEISTEKLKSTSIRVVQITDLHCEAVKGNEAKLKDLINPLEPDIIVFTGDALNDITALGSFKAALASLDAKYGKFAVMGNNDRWFKSSDLFSETGFKVLNGEYLQIVKNNEPFNIAGINYGNEYMQFRLLNSIPANSYNIFLYHSPDLVEEIDNEKADLYLAGHTHGGQVRLPFYGALLTFSKFGKKYEMGKYEVGKTILYVNKGLGMEGAGALRVRFLAKPEITVFDIKPDKK